MLMGLNIYYILYHCLLHVLDFHDESEYEVWDADYCKISKL